MQRQPVDIFNDDVPYRASIQTILDKGISRLLQHKNSITSIKPGIQFSIFSNLKLSKVKAARPRAQPNAGFLKQLKMYESSILNNDSKPNS